MLKRSDKATAAGGTVTGSSGAAGRVRDRLGVTIASSLQFKDVSHRYGDHETLSGLSLDIAPGEVVALLGPSGSGKTTLLRLAAGLAQPSGGSVLMNRQVVSSAEGMVPPEKRGVGLVFQDFALFPHLTIRRNVEFGLTRLAAEERARYADYMLRTVGLAEKAGRYPHHLSGGEQQRVALARALAPKPGILLMDEPFSGLDGRLRDQVRDESLAILRASRATVMVVTHDPEEALRIADRIALIEGGRIVQYGTCEELYHHPVNLFAARFFSEVNLLPGQLVGSRIDTPLGSFSAPGHLAGRDGAVTVCLRPSDVAVDTAEGAGRRRGEENRLSESALVKSVRFLGESELVELYVPKGELAIEARIACGSGVAPGRTVRLSFDPALAQVFAADTQA